MFNKIARLDVDNGYTVEIGFEVPEVITQDTRVDATTRILVTDPEKEIDVESVEYKQALSVAEVLKIGFQIGCSYTTKVMEQVNKMGESLLNNPRVTPVNEENITGSTSDLIVEE